ncbi:MAG TPA: T9SS type A sorting domain-containing protein [bacterium]|jgi:hypothetical protein
MLRHTHKGLPLVVLLALMLASAAMAQQYAIPSSAVANGASSMLGASYQIRGTVGQPIISVSTGASYADSAGFWYTTRASAPSAVGDPPPSLPRSFSLRQNYPNPFNPATEIRFEVPSAARVTLKVFNVEGQLVETLADQNFSVGEHAIQWNADKHASGLYLIRMSAPGFTEIRRAVLLK